MRTTGERTNDRASEHLPDAASWHADERAEAARSVPCQCQAGIGMPCGPYGDHLARYLQAERQGVITRSSLHEVIAGLDVITPRVLIWPPAERGACTAGAWAADQVPGAQSGAEVLAIPSAVPGRRQAQEPSRRTGQEAAG